MGGGVDMGGWSGSDRKEWIWEEGVDMGGESGCGKRELYGRREYIWKEGVDMGGGSAYRRISEQLKEGVGMGRRVGSNRIGAFHI